ncbi:hypothetical protein [Streptomyces griseocarneus]|uniref:hypothetical protein n=1 Tax=Streptomyces griseocarneus TaxID=51201 RepID=UPI00167DCC52|nr:hypothetical protein [Streptomyces griseocarneus]MBZ6477508.1 hypothetical protein [Streptomyces griseocarneus]GHG82781.1 hypothetical protein GCM10018779_65710 [Streptomyces griseocarneus]
MSSRTRSHKVRAGSSTVRIPRQSRWRRSSTPFVVVVPERPPLSLELLAWFARLLWRHRIRLAPLALATAAWPLTALLHALAWWSGLLFAVAAVLPLGWMVHVNAHRPAGQSASRWRLMSAAVITAAMGWLALAASFGPTTDPLPLTWLLITITTQTGWSVLRRMPASRPASRKETH